MMYTKKSDLIQESIMNNAGFWKRFVAVMIDFVILVTLTFLLMMGIGIVIGGMMHDPELMTKFSQFGMLMDVVMFWLYFALQESSPLQATLGKRLLGIYVTDSNGERLTFIRATIRYFSKYLSSVFMIGFIMAAFTKNKQGLHDLIADTLVVNR